MGRERARGGLPYKNDGGARGTFRGYFYRGVRRGSVKTPKDGLGDQVESQGQENIKSIRSLSGSLVHNLSGYYSKNYSNRTTGKWNKTLSRE